MLLFSYNNVKVFEIMEKVIFEFRFNVFLGFGKDFVFLIFFNLV